MILQGEGFTIETTEGPRTQHAHRLQPRIFEARAAASALALLKLPHTSQLGATGRPPPVPQLSRRESRATAGAPRAPNHPMLCMRHLIEAAGMLPKMNAAQARDQ